MNSRSKLSYNDACKLHIDAVIEILPKLSMTDLQRLVLFTDLELEQRLYNE